MVQLDTFYCHPLFAEEVYQTAYSTFQVDAIKKRHSIIKKNALVLHRLFTELSHDLMHQVCPIKCAFHIYNKKAHLFISNGEMCYY